MAGELTFDLLGPGDYERAKAVLNKAKRPGFVGRELFFRCATTGTCTIAVLDGADVGVALVASQKLQALSVVSSAQGAGVGARLIDRVQPRWASVIQERVEWFKRRGYVEVGPPKVSQKGTTTTQLMERTGEPLASTPREPRPAPPPTPAAPERGPRHVLEVDPASANKATLYAEAVRLLSDPEATFSSVAEALKISRRQLFNWRQDPLYRLIESEYLDSVMSAARAELKAMVLEAVAALRAALSCEPGSEAAQRVRAEAARAVLDRVGITAATIGDDKELSEAEIDALLAKLGLVQAQEARH